MAKSTSSKKAAKKTSETNAAYSKKNNDQQRPAMDNTSKYQPTEDARMEALSLDPEDGIMKLFIDCIKDIYWAENHLIKALPKMAKAASLSSLQQAILNHLEHTKEHAARLEQVFGILGKKPQAKKCEAMEGLTKEGEGVIETTDSGTPARDLGIILSAQKVEHYEISSYMGLIKLATNLGLTEVADLLSQTLTEEEESDELLADIADSDLISFEMNIAESDQSATGSPDEDDR